MTIRRQLLIVALVAVSHGLFFTWYQRPDWNVAWSDQDGYRRLGAVLAETGKFTRFPDAPRFVPEVLRTPAYPLFVAAIYRVFGVHQLAVALAQTILFALIALTAYAVAAEIAPAGVAVAAAAATALFPPLPYFAALVMTEVWTTFLFTLAMLVALRARGGRVWRRAALAGFLLAATTLSRPVFVLFPFALAALWAILAWLGLDRTPWRARAAALVAAFAVTMLPWFTYNYVTLGRFTLSPAGGVGRGLWEGSWQAVWPGRLQNQLTHLADDIDDRAALDRAVGAVAAGERRPVEPMLTYVHQWQDVRRIWTEPTDPNARAEARVVADGEYLRVGLENLRRDSAAHLAKRLARGLFVLWAGEIPFRYSDINDLPPIVVRIGWAVQALVFLAALVGVYVLARAGQTATAIVLALPIAYVSAVHALLLTEARQSLPAQPVLLVLATVAVAWIARRSLALEPQVHEAEHL